MTQDFSKKIQDHRLNNVKTTGFLKEGLGGFSIILILGIVNFGFLLFQLPTGLRWIKVPFGVHRKTGIAFFITASVHGLLGLIAG